METIKETTIMSGGKTYIFLGENLEELKEVYDFECFICPSPDIKYIIRTREISCEEARLRYA